MFVLVFISTQYFKNKKINDIDIDIDIADMKYMWKRMETQYYSISVTKNREKKKIYYRDDRIDKIDSICYVIL